MGGWGAGRGAGEDSRVDASGVQAFLRRVVYIPTTQPPSAPRVRGPLFLPAVLCVFPKQTQLSPLTILLFIQFTGVRRVETWPLTKGGIKREDNLNGYELQQVMGSLLFKNCAPTPFSSNFQKCVLERGQPPTRHLKRQVFTFKDACRCFLRNRGCLLHLALCSAAPTAVCVR